MSIGQDGVKIDMSGKKNRFFIFVLVCVQFVLSVFLYISFAAHIVWPDKTQGAAGVVQMLSYEGRLTDSSGNPLGGTGEPYCFRFSIYSDSTIGAPDTKLWPSGTPNTTKATTTDGIFTALVGQADTLDFNFYDNDEVYLNVEVNTATSTCSGSWETLGPRQRIAAAGYSIAAKNVYSSLLKTDISNSRVQVGAGTGGASPIYLGLDVKNTADYVGQSCTTNGTVWYNSAISKALVCENSVIQAVSNATTTIAAINANGGTPASNGTVVFSNSNGVSFGINGNTITASVNAGGGGAQPQRWKELYIRPTISNVTNLTAINGTPIFQPFYIDGTLTVSRLNVELSRSTSGSNHFTVYAGIYSYVNNSQISLLASASNSFSNTATASVSGIRRLAVSGFDVSTLAPGGYVLGMIFTATATASMNYSLRGGQTAAPVVGGILAGANQYNTATSYNFFPFYGRFTAASAAMPVSVADSQIRGQFTGASSPLPWWVGLNND